MSSAWWRCSVRAAFGGGVSILSSSRHVFGRTSRRLRYPLRRVSILSSSRHVFGRRFPDRLASGVRPVSILSSSRHVFGLGAPAPALWLCGGFNPLVIEACLRPGRRILDISFQHRRFNPLVIEACLRPGHDEADRRTTERVSILSSSRHVFGQAIGRVTGRAIAAQFQSSRHRGMSSAPGHPEVLWHNRLGVAIRQPPSRRRRALAADGVHAAPKPLCRNSLRIPRTLPPMVVRRNSLLRTPLRAEAARAFRTRTPARQPHPSPRRPEMSPLR